MLRTADRSSSSLARRKAAKASPVTYGDALIEVEGDHAIKTDPQENSRRRTIVLEKRDNSWGFTLQSYGLHSKLRNEVELLTYVDYVEIGSAAYEAGLRSGDVILSVNGISVENVEHSALVHFIKSCGNIMRMVVLFEDCCRKVELHARHLKLKKMLHEKLFELRALEDLERHILSGKRLHDAAHLSLASSMTSLNTSSSSMECVSLCPELDVCSYFDRRRMGSHSLLPRSERLTPVPQHVSSAGDYGSLPLRGEKARRARALAVASTPSPYARGSLTGGRSNGFYGGSSHSLSMGMPLSPEPGGGFEPALFSMTSISEVDGDENAATLPSELTESSTDPKQVATDLNASTIAQERLSSDGSSARNNQHFLFDSQLNLCVTPECVKSRDIASDIHSISSPLAMGESILPDVLAIDCQSISRIESSRDTHSLSSYALIIPPHSGQRTPHSPSMNSARLYVGSPPLSPRLRASDSRRHHLTRTQSRDSQRSLQKRTLPSNNTSSLSSFISQKISSHFRDLGNTLADGGKSKASTDTPQLLHYRRIYSDVLPPYLNMQPTSQLIERNLRMSSKSLPSFSQNASTVAVSQDQENDGSLCNSCGLLSCACLVLQNGHSTVALSPLDTASVIVDIDSRNLVQNSESTHVILEGPNDTSMIIETEKDTLVKLKEPNNARYALDDVVVHVQSSHDADELDNGITESPEDFQEADGDLVVHVNGSHDDADEQQEEAKVESDESLSASQISCGLMQHELINEENSDTYL